MNREEFIKHQEDMINELFPPEHRREVAEYAQDMLADACKEMERLYGKGWKEKAKADYDRKTAFLTEMQKLLEKYDMTIGTFEGCTVPTMPYGVMFGSRYQNGGDIYVFYDMPVISSDNIFDYEKE